MTSLTPSNFANLFAKSELLQGTLFSKSTQFLNFLCAISNLSALFCKVSSRIQGKLTNSQQVFDLVSPNSLQRTQRLLSSLKAQPMACDSSSKQCEVFRQHRIMLSGVRHSSHSYLMNKRSPESMRDMMVSSAWKPQLIPKESLESREASRRVQDWIDCRYRFWFQRERQYKQPQRVEEKTMVVRERSRRLCNIFLNIFIWLLVSQVNQ